MSRSTLLAALIATFSLSGMALSGVAVAGTDETLTKKQFLKVANATCTDAYRQIDATFEEELSDLSGNEQPSNAQLRRSSVRSPRSSTPPPPRSRRSPARRPSRRRSTAS